MIPNKVTAIQNSTLTIMENNNVIVGNREITITTSSDENPITSYEYVPYKDLTIGVNYQGGKLISYTQTVDKDSDYARSKLSISAAAFFMSVCGVDGDEAESVVVYLFSNYTETDTALVTELDRGGFTLKLEYTYEGLISLSIYPQ